MNLNNLQSLEEAVGAIKQFCETQNLPDTVCFNINLVCEELIVNLLSYTESQSYHLELNPLNGKTEIILRYAGPEFDPTKPPKTEDKSVEERPYGGLGLILVNTLASKTGYRYDKKQAQNVIRVIV